LSFTLALDASPGTVSPDYYFYTSTGIVLCVSTFCVSLHSSTPFSPLLPSDGIMMRSNFAFVCSPGDPVARYIGSHGNRIASRASLRDFRDRIQQFLLPPDVSSSKLLMSSGICGMQKPSS
jgi:hypothetical protein